MKASFSMDISAIRFGTNWKATILSTLPSTYTGSETLKVSTSLVFRTNN